MRPQRVGIVIASLQSSDQLPIPPIFDTPPLVRLQSHVK
jgi:hypothetical protein